MTSQLIEEQLRVLAAAAEGHPRCAECAVLWRPGWESVSGATQVGHLMLVGSLRTEDAADHLEEYHPQGTHLWSPQAPIALGWHPYNQCSVWSCTACKSAFLRYTEYGGYYQEERLRPLLAELLCTPKPR
ncbi:hypothetical protein [Variovorax sp. J31P207]|uniref:hypothetical protein n=1 Tax=Variovorax sp. J31P207 TaxID=3053510 RepID=UPI002578DE67|nr:hypothetical protein [Variovorax sp. J31P207]MDM0070656.1 hypothetical protein [Variovorax sp. J31P207]